MQQWNQLDNPWLALAGTLQCRGRELAVARLPRAFRLLPRAAAAQVYVAPREAQKALADALLCKGPGDQSDMMHRCIRHMPIAIAPWRAAASQTADACSSAELRMFREGRQLSPC